MGGCYRPLGRSKAMKIDNKEHLFKRFNKLQDQEIVKIAEEILENETRGIKEIVVWA